MFQKTVNSSFVLLYIGMGCMYFDFLLPISTRNIRISDFFILLSAVALLASPSNLKYFLPPGNRYALPASVFVFLGTGFAIFQSMVSINDLLPTCFAAVQLLFVFVVLGGLCMYHCRNPGRKWRLLQIHAMLVGGCGLVSLTDWFGVTHMAIQTYYRHTNPILGINGFAWVGLLTNVALASCTFDFYRKRLFSGGFWIVIICLMLVGLFLAGVRAGLVLLLIGFTWFLVAFGRHWLSFALRRNQIIVLLALCCALTISIYIGYQSYLLFPSFSIRASAQEGFFDLTDRTEAYQMAFAAAEQGGFFLGIGLNQSQQNFPDLPIVSHNIYLQALVESGFIGLVAIIFLFAIPTIAILRDKRRAYHLKDLDDQLLCHSSIWIIIGMAIMGMVYPLGYNRSDWALFLIAGVSTFAKKKPS